MRLAWLKLAKIYKHRSSSSLNDLSLLRCIDSKLELGNTCLVMDETTDTRSDCLEGISINWLEAILHG